MPHSQKADLFRRRRECNAAKRRGTAVSSSVEAVRFQRPSQNSREYFSGTPLGYTQTGVLLVDDVDSSLPSSASLNDNRNDLLINQSEYVVSDSCITSTCVPSLLFQGIIIICMPLIFIFPNFFPASFYVICLYLLSISGLLRTHFFCLLFWPIRLFLYGIQMRVHFYSIPTGHLYSVPAISFGFLSDA